MAVPQLNRHHLRLSCFLIRLQCHHSPNLCSFHLTTTVVLSVSKFVQSYVARRRPLRKTSAYDSDPFFILFQLSHFLSCCLFFQRRIRFSFVLDTPFHFLLSRVSPTSIRLMATFYSSATRWHSSLNQLVPDPLASPIVSSNFWRYSTATPSADNRWIVKCIVLLLLVLVTLDYCG